MRSISLWKYSIATVAFLWGLGIGGSLLRQAQAVAVCASASPSNICCGDTITINKTLNADLNCTGNDPHSPTLIVDGGVTLDLNGHTVICHTTIENGIELIGSGATLTSGAAANGVVGLCDEGVLLAGTGGHSVSKVTSTNNIDDGFEVESTSTSNTLNDNTATNNGGNGFQVDSDKNSLDNNISFNNDFGFFVTGRRNLLTNNDNVSLNDNDGFFVDSDKNRLVDNTADDNGSDGFNIEGKKNFLTNNIANSNNDDGFSINNENNKLTANTSNGNSNSGFDVDGFKHKLINNQANNNSESGFQFDETAQNATVSGNTANGNATGFDVGGSGHNLVRNTATNNSTDGFLVTGDSNQLKRNTADANSDNGIDVSGSNNGVRQNEATSNTSFDLKDDNENCDGNQWNHNTFGTANISPPVSANCIH